MKIGIFETTHFEGAYPVIRLFDNGVNEITIFTYEAAYRQFQFLFKAELSKFQWVVKGNNESKYNFIWRIYKETKSRNLQLLYLNTISDNFIFYAEMISLLKGLRIIMTLHSINNYFEHKLKFSLRRLVRILGKKKLIRAVKEFNVVALTMVDYLKEKLPSSGKVHCVPGAVYENRSSPGRNKISRLVVPGLVDERRRNYEDVIQLVEKLEKVGMEVSITLLGGVHPEFGKPIIEKIKKSGWRNRLKYYQAEVDQPEFDKVMDEADIVFVPSAIQISIQDDIEEVYGLSMSSGNMFDIIKHAKPFIAPLALRVDPFLENSCLRYQTVDEIVDILIALSESPEEYASLQSKAKVASTSYTIEAVRKRNPELFV